MTPNRGVVLASHQCDVVGIVFAVISAAVVAVAAVAVTASGTLLVSAQGISRPNRTGLLVRSKMTFVLNEAPLKAASFHDSIGINTDWYAGKTAAQTSADIANLSALKVTHIREFWGSAGAGWGPNMHTAGSHGFKIDVVLGGIATPAATIQQLPSIVGSGLESIEQTNEFDGSGDSSWVADLSSYVKSTSYPTIHAMGYPALGPALAYSGNAVSLGDLHNYLDIGTSHNYLGGAYNPGVSSGLYVVYPGCNVFEAFSPDFDIACEANVSGPVTFSATSPVWSPASFASGSKPQYSTETGYTTDRTLNGGVDYTTQAKFIPRLMLLNYMAGKSRTYLWHLVDFSGTYFGIIDSSNNKKPAFYALQSLSNMLLDSSTSFTPTALAYTIAGAPTALAHALFQNSSGQYVLALWNETAGWTNPSATGGSAITVPPQTVTLQLPFVPTAINIQAIANTGRLGSVARTISGNSVSFNVDDHVAFVTFSNPSASQARRSTLLNGAARSD